MHTIVNTIQEIKGTKTEVLMLFGTGRLTNDPPELRETGTGKRYCRHRKAIALRLLSTTDRIRMLHSMASKLGRKQLS